MKKIKFYIQLSFILTTLLSCSSENTADTAIQEKQNTETLVNTSNIAGELIKKLVDKRFVFADKNKDKKLDFNEFKNLEDDENNLKDLFDKIDKSKNSFIEYQEFLKSDSESIKSNLEEAFKMIDKNENMLIEQDGELEMVAEIESESSEDSGNVLTIENVKKDYLSYDSNKDGSLDFQEYLLPELKYMLMKPIEQ